MFVERFSTKEDGSKELFMSMCKMICVSIWKKNMNGKNDERVLAAFSLPSQSLG